MNTTTAVDELVKLVTDMFWQPLPKEEESLRRQFGDLFADFAEREGITIQLVKSMNCRHGVQFKEGLPDNSVCRNTNSLYLTKSVLGKVQNPERIEVVVRGI